MTSEAKINIAPLPANVDCSVRFTFINLYTQKIVLYEWPYSHIINIIIIITVIIVIITD